MLAAPNRGMGGVRNFRELRAWQAAMKFKRAIYSLIDSGALARDFKLQGQLREAAASAVSHIAEGYGRWNPADFARFVVMGRASMIECQNHLDDAVDRRFISEKTRATHEALAEAALREIGGLLDYLQSPEAEENAKRAKARRIKRRQRRTQNENSNPEPGTGNPEQ